MTNWGSFGKYMGVYILYFTNSRLRRLVSKPSGNSSGSSTSLHGSPAGAGLTFPGGGGSSGGSATVPSNNSNPSLGGASSLGQPETEGSIVVGGRAGAQSSRGDNVNSAASQLDAHIPTKRRKRSRLNDQHTLGVTILFSFLIFYTLLLTLENMREREKLFFLFLLSHFLRAMSMEKLGTELYNFVHISSPPSTYCFNLKILPLPFCQMIFYSFI